MTKLHSLQSNNRLAAILEVIGDKSRYKIFCNLLNDEDVCVTEMSERVGISIPGTSQHLRVMELAGVVQPVRIGHKICYELTDDPLVRSLSNFIEANLDEA